MYFKTYALGSACRALFVGAICSLGFASAAVAQEPICSSPDVIFCEDFESTNWASRWQEVSHPTRKTRETNPQHVYSGGASLRLTFPGGDSDGAGWMHHWWDPSPTQGTRTYLRWYVKYDTGFDWGSWDVKMAGLEGHPPGVRYGPGAGVRPDGTWFDVRLLALGVPNGTGAARQPLFYYSHINQNSQWGDFAHQDRAPAVTLATNRWYCMELMVGLNDPASSDGEMMMWIDGVLKGHRTGIRWRTQANVQTNHLFWSGWIGEPTHSGNQYRWEDNLVVSRAPIGCMAGGTPTPPGPPTNVRIIR